MDWIISLLCGAGGGNLAGMLLKKLSLGTIGNSIVGILGGAGGQALMGSTGIDLGNNILNSVAGGGVGGGVLLAIVGLIKKVIGK